MKHEQAGHREKSALADRCGAASLVSGGAPGCNTRRTGAFEHRRLGFFTKTSRLSSAGPKDRLSSPGRPGEETAISTAAPPVFEPPARPALAPGDHAPLFTCRDSEGKSFEFYSAVTGQPVVMVFTGASDLSVLSAAGLTADALGGGAAQVVTLVPGDVSAAAGQKGAAAWPHRVMADPNSEITKGFAGLSGIKAPAVYVLDPNQRLVGARALDGDGGAEGLSGWIADMLAQAAYGREAALVQRMAPALIVPRALEPEDCDWLIGLWHQGPRDDGTVAVGASAGGGVQVVPTTKRREDYYMRDQALHQKLVDRLMPRLVPEVSKIFHFEGYTVETFKIGCYKAEKAGFFNVHRDDTSPATQNRRFAVTLNLNTGEYEGGDLRFPEYGPETFRPEKGAAIVFSCSMLHEVMPVTKGHRFVLLTFLTVPPQG